MASPRLHDKAPHVRACSQPVSHARRPERDGDTQKFEFVCLRRAGMLPDGCVDYGDRPVAPLSDHKHANGDAIRHRAGILAGQVLLGFADERIKVIRSAIRARGPSGMGWQGSYIAIVIHRSRDIAGVQVVGGLAVSDTGRNKVPEDSLTSCPVEWN